MAAKEPKNKASKLFPRIHIEVQASLCDEWHFIVRRDQKGLLLSKGYRNAANCMRALEGMQEKGLITPGLPITVITKYKLPIEMWEEGLD